MKKITAVLVLICMFFSQVAYAAKNRHEELEAMIANNDTAGINKWVWEERKTPVKTAEITINVDENNITKPARRYLLGHGGENLPTFYETTRDSSGTAFSEDFESVADDLYEVPVVRWGGHRVNVINALGTVGPLTERYNNSYLKDIGFERYYPQLDKAGQLNDVETAGFWYGPMEWVEDMERINPDTAFIFCLSISNASPEENANFLRYLLDDKDESEWGKRRANDGHPEPVNVVAIELGNELYNNDDFGDEINYSKVSWYVETFEKHANAMMEYYPDMYYSPCLVSCADYRTFDIWNRYVIEKLGDKHKLMSHHWYYSGWELAYNEWWTRRIIEIAEETWGPDHGIKLALTEHAKWAIGDYRASQTIESALATCQFLNRLLQLPDWYWAANYYGFGATSKLDGRMFWSHLAWTKQGTLVENPVGKMYRLYTETMGDRVVATTAEHHNSVLGDVTSTAQKLSYSVTAAGDNELRIIISNRAENEDANIKFNFQNQYTLVEETIMTAPNGFSLIYDDSMLDVIEITTNKKNEANFTSYNVPCVSLICLTLKTNSKIPKLASGDGAASDSEIVYEGEPLYGDIDSHWAKDEINLITQDGYMSGEAEAFFNPEAEMTRAQVAVVLQRITGATGSVADAVADVVDEDWYSAGVKSMLSEGYMTLDANKCFNPADTVKLMDIISSVYRIATNKNAALDKAEYVDAIDKASGVSGLNDFEKEALAFAIHYGILDNFYEHIALNPDHSITRGEGAAILYRFARYLSKI